MPLRESEFFKDTRLGFERGELPRRGPIPRDISARRVCPDDRQPLGIAVRKRTQQEAVDDAEYCTVGTNAQSQSEHGDSSEARILEEHSRAVAQVLKYCLHSQISEIEFKRDYGTYGNNGTNGKQ